MLLNCPPFVSSFYTASDVGLQNTFKLCIADVQVIAPNSVTLRLHRSPRKRDLNGKRKLVLCNMVLSRAISSTAPRFFEARMTLMHFAEATCYAYRCSAHWDKQRQLMARKEPSAIRVGSGCCRACGALSWMQAVAAVAQAAVARPKRAVSMRREQRGNWPDGACSAATLDTGCTPCHRSRRQGDVVAAAPQAVASPRAVAPDKPLQIMKSNST